MGIREEDLTKISNFVQLLDQWRTDAESLGLELKSVVVSPGQYSDNTIWYNDDQTPGFWQID